MKKLTLREQRDLLLAAVEFYANAWREENKIILGDPNYNGGIERQIMTHTVYPADSLMRDCGILARSTILKIKGE